MKSGFGTTPPSSISKKLFEFQTPEKKASTHYESTGVTPCKFSIGLNKHADLAEFT